MSWVKKQRIPATPTTKPPDRTRKDLICGPAFREIVVKLAQVDATIAKAISRIDMANLAYARAISRNAMDGIVVRRTGNEVLSAVDYLWALTKDLPEVKKIVVYIPRPTSTIDPLYDSNEDVGE